MPCRSGRRKRSHIFIEGNNRSRFQYLAASFSHYVAFSQIASVWYRDIVNEVVAALKYKIPRAAISMTSLFRQRKHFSNAFVNAFYDKASRRPPYAECRRNVITPCWAIAIEYASVADEWRGYWGLVSKDNGHRLPMKRLAARFAGNNINRPAAGEYNRIGK